MPATIRVMRYTPSRALVSAFQGLVIAGLLFCNFFALTRSDARAEESHPGLAAEAMYAEALLAYNRKRIDEAIKLLDEAIKLDPGNIPALEMRALTLKIKGDDARSVQVYRQLVQNKPEAERGPYYFELGTLYVRNKKPELARAMFERCLGLKFNRVPSHFYLGTIAFGANDHKRAEYHLTVAANEAPGELKVASLYYLGLVNFKNGQGALGVANVVEARTLARDMPDNKLAQDIGQSTDKVLEPFSRAQWFVNATMLGQYDTNIAQLPLGIVDPAQTSGKATPKMSVTGGFGRMSAPLSTIQLVASYRGSYNKNFNTDAADYEFFSNTGSVYLNYRPLAKTTGGIKVDSSYVFQHALVSRANPAAGYTFRGSSLTVDGGAFIKFYLTRDLLTNWDVGYRTMTSYTTPDSSGKALHTRATLMGVGTSSAYWNPGGTIHVEKSDARTAASSYLALGGGVTNSMRLSSRDGINLSVDLVKSSYPAAALSRSDMNVPIRASWSRKLSAHWSMLVDMSYTLNRSSIPTSYSYNRFLLGAGLGWSL